MNVRHQRDMYLLLNFRKRPRRLHMGHRAPDNLAPRPLQPQNLRHRRLHVLCRRICHGLHQNRISPANLPIPYCNDFRLFSICSHVCLHTFLVLFILLIHGIIAKRFFNVDTLCILYNP